MSRRKSADIGFMLCSGLHGGVLAARQQRRHSPARSLQQQAGWRQAACAAPRPQSRPTCNAQRANHHLGLQWAPPALGAALQKHHGLHNCAFCKTPLRGISSSWRAWGVGCGARAHRARGAGGARKASRRGEPHGRLGGVGGRHGPPSPLLGPSTSDSLNVTCALTTLRLSDPA